MPQVGTTVEIDAAPDVVFRWLIEPDKLSRWIGGFLGSEPLTSGGARLGARSRDTVGEAGRTIVAETEITEFEPGRLMRLRIVAGGVTQDDTYRLTPQGDGTNIEYTSDVHVRGLIRLLAPIVARQAQARADRDFASLKRQIEADPD